MPSVSPSYDYSTGTISIANGDNVVVGSGLGATGWGGAVARRGDTIILDYGGANEKVSVIVNTVPGHTDQLELPRYTGPDLVNVPYIIYWISPTRVAGAEALEDVSRLVSYLNTSGIFVYVDTADTVPDPSLGEPGQQALQPSTGKTWIKTGGLWVYVGTFKGFNFIDGGYNPATEYHYLDVFIEGGNTYLVMTDTVGHAPPNATYYRVMASAGVAATIEVHSTTTGAPGSNATVTNVGTVNAASLDFVIPRGNPGVDGVTPTLAAGTTTTGAPGTNAAVADSGSGSNHIFNFTIPRGNPGVDGGTTFPTVRLVLTTNVNLTNALINAATFDGVAVATGDVVLLTGQTAATENGIYTVVASGAASRTAPYTTFVSLAGIYISVMEGTAFKDTLWQCTSDRGGTIGSTAIAISQFKASSTQRFEAVRTVSLTNINIATDLENGDSIDSVALATGDFVLLAAQTTASQNGIYQVVASGAASRVAAWNTYDSMAGAYFSVMEGTLFQDTLWRCVSNRGGVLGTTALSFSLFNMSRERLVADRTYYVRTDGNDSNTGLANTSGGAFLTKQKAVDTLASLDCGIFNGTILVADGTYTGSVTLKWIFGSGTYSITGNITTPANCFVNVTGNSCFICNGHPTQWTINGFKLAASNQGIMSLSGANLIVGAAMEYGVCGGYHIYCSSANLTHGAGTVRISGNAACHLNVSGGGVVSYGSPCNYNIVAAVTIGQFVFANRGSVVTHFGGTFSGSVVTGTKYLVQSGAIIDTNGGGANYFPGSTAGSNGGGPASNGGFYV